MFHRYTGFQRSFTPFSGFLMAQLLRVSGPNWAKASLWHLSAPRLASDDGRNAIVGLLLLQKHGATFGPTVKLAENDPYQAFRQDGRGEDSPVGGYPPPQGRSTFFADILISGTSTYPHAALRHCLDLDTRQHWRRLARATRSSIL